MAAFWFSLLTAFALSAGGSDRTLVYFSSDNCVACRAMKPVVDGLRSEGWSVRRIDSESDREAKNQWNIQAIPTLIVLNHGAEVDRIVGKLSRNELDSRLAATGLTDDDRSKSTVPSEIKTPPDHGSIYGPNHPLYKPRPSPYSILLNTPPSNSAEDRRPLLGPNHPLYSRYYPSRAGNETKSGLSLAPSRVKKKVNPLLKDVSQLPDFPISMSATVRIRIRYPKSESIGTGTIIETVGDQALILTCGHLFRKEEPTHPVVVELFQSGKTIRSPGTVVEFRDDGVDLGLIKFRQSIPLTKARIRPKSEPLQELEPVFSIGCDLGSAPLRRDSVIAKLNRYVGCPNIEIAGAPIQGRSGGGLFDAQGRLAGVCFAADDELDEGLFVGLEAVYAQLAKYHLNRLFE